MNRRSMMEVSIAVMYMMHTISVVENNVGGAHAYNIAPPDGFYRPPQDFGGGSRRPGRRRHQQFQEDQPPQQYYDQEPNDSWFHNEHQRHEDDFYPPPHYFHHGRHHGRYPPPHPFPPPHPHFAHPRFMDQPRPLPQPPVVQLFEEQQSHDMSYTQLATTPGTSSALEHQEQPQTSAVTAAAPPIQNIWKTSAPTLIESSTLETFAFDSPAVERVQILLKKGRRHGRKHSGGQDPALQAHIDVWHGPDSTPQNLAIYLEDEDEEDDDDELVFGGQREEDLDDTTNFSAIIQTPQGYNTIAVRNTAPNHDLLACVEGEEEDPSDIDSNGRPHYHVGGDPSGYYYDEPMIRPETITRTSETSNRDAADRSDEPNGSPLQSVIDRLMATSIPQLVEGKATSDRNSVANDLGNGQMIRTDIYTVPLASNVASVQVLLRSDFMHPLQARVELILKEQGSDGNPGRVLKRTIVEVFSEDGMHRPFFAVLETPRKRKRRNRRYNSDDDLKKYSVSMRVINCSGSDFPLYASVEPYIIDTSSKEKKSQSRTDNVEGNCDPSNGRGEWEEEYSNKVNHVNYSEEGEDILENDWWEESLEKAHFGGGSHWDMSTNSTILDAEIL